MTQYIWGVCGLGFSKEIPTKLYENNTTYISQLKEGYIKGDMTKHISSKLFLFYDLQNNGDIDIWQICSGDNLADLFTKALFISRFEKLIYNIRLHWLRNIK